MTQTTTATRAYRAVCFDLDGTLLAMDMEEFLGGYFARLARFMVKHGADPDRLKMALNAGTRSMGQNNGPRTNEQAYWDTFMELIGKDAPEQEQRTKEEWIELFTEFYQTDFDLVGEGVVPDAHMVRAVQTLAQKGYPLLLTTTPLFPLMAVERRLGWAGLDPSLFCRVTNYENSSAAKPSLRYYAENLAAMGLEGADVLMVGNNTVEDLAFCKLGADAFLMTDYLIDPIDLDLSTVKHGSAQEFAAWVDALPACADPVADVATEALDPQVVEATLERCAQMSAEQQQAAQDEAEATKRYYAKVMGQPAE
ncbi:MAG: HAD family hydrolase [Coriobacteriia bacterium]|nr:HAD family hydrolase [Coriobacteriia bacterium]